MRKPPIDPKEIWNRRFSGGPLNPVRRSLNPGAENRDRQVTVDDTYEPWLERWMPLLQAAGSGPILDLGCGSGRDA